MLKRGVNIKAKMLSLYHMTTIILFSLFVNIKPETETVSYHILDPMKFKMYNSCLSDEKRPLTGTHNIHVLKHFNEIYFIDQLLRLNKSVESSKADLIVIPVYYSLSFLGLCRLSHKKNVEDLKMQLEEEIKQIGGEGTNKRKFLIVAGHWPTHGDMSRFSLFTQHVIHGWFENDYYHPERSFPIGYVSFLEAQKYSSSENISKVCGEGYKFIPFHQRKYRYSFLGNLYYGNPSYKNRQLLFLQKNGDRLVTNEEMRIYENTSESFVFINKMSSHISRSYPLDCTLLMSTSFQSQMIMSFKGDTSTTDRIYLAFETISLIGYVATKNEIKEFLLNLPYPSRIPWPQIVVFINASAYVENPHKTLIDAVESMSVSERQNRLRLMRRHRGDVLYLRNDSRVFDNILSTAWEKIKYR